MLYVEVLGNFFLRHNNQPLPCINTAKLRAVLVYLLLHCQTPQSRHYSAAVLWPRSTDSQARTNLRKYLHQLRQALPDAERYFCTDNNIVQWMPTAPYIFDAAEFESAIEVARRARENNDASTRRAALTNAVETYRGDLLPECYDEWIVQPRQRLSQAYLYALAELAVVHEKQRDYPAAILYLQRLLQRDPLREAAYRHLMRLYALNSDRGKALETFEQCRHILEEELGVSPSQATLNVYHRLKLIQSPPRRQQSRAEQSIPFVGRRAEWEKLHTAWHKAVMDKPHFALISGVAGIGKTRLAEEFITWANKQGFATATTRTYAVDKPLAYASLIGWLRTSVLQRAVSQLDSVWQTELSRLLPELHTKNPHLPRPDPLSESWQRQRLFESIGLVLCMVDQPSILFIDDLQWCDEQTLACLHYLTRLETETNFLVVGTLRPEERNNDIPLSNLLTSLHRSRQLTEIKLNPLDQAESATIAAHIVGRYLDVNENERLFQETEGNALFIVEMMRAELPFASMPDSIQAIIERRLRQLSPQARRLADLAAVIGRNFSFAVLSEASGEDEYSLLTALDECCHRFIIQEPDGNSYDFTHDKIREVVYRNLSRARRQFLHRRIAEALETIADTSEFAGELVYHYTEAGKIEKVVQYRLEAGKQALALAAYREAYTCLQHGLELLRTLPHSPDRTQTEMQFLMALGASAVPWKGFIAPDVHQIYTDAIHLLADLPQSSELVPVIYGLGQYYMLRGEWKTGFFFGKQCLSLAQSTNDPNALMLAHTILGCTSCYMGDLQLALVHLKSSLSYYNDASLPNTGVDNRILCKSFIAMALWILGYAEQAHTTMQTALSLAREQNTPQALAVALTYAAQVALMEREPLLAQKFSNEAIKICTKYELRHWLSASNVIHGWALARQGKNQQGIQQIHAGMATLASMVRLDAYTYPILAEVYAMANDIDNCRDALNHALTQASLTDVRCFESMTLRIRGDLLVQSGAPFEEVEAAYQQAIEFARTQEAKFFELHATIPLCRLYQQQGKIADARQMLSGIYNWFTEGFDTPDLKEARALLEELA